MDLKNAIRSLSALQTISFGLLVGNLILGAGIVYAVIALNNTHERLVLIPPHLDEKAVLAWDYADKEYLKNFGLYVAVFVGNLQPETAGTMIQAISNFVNPAVYHEFRRRLLTLLDDPILKQLKTVVTFQPRRVILERSTSRVFVTGELISKSVAFEGRKTVTYEMIVRIRSGRPWIDYFTSYEGDEARTFRWYQIKLTAGRIKEIPPHAIPEKLRPEELRTFKPDDTDLSIWTLDESTPAPATTTQPAEPAGAAQAPVSAPTASGDAAVGVTPEVVPNASPAGSQPVTAPAPAAAPAAPTAPEIEELLWFDRDGKTH